MIGKTAFLCPDCGAIHSGHEVFVHKTKCETTEPLVRVFVFPDDNKTFHFTENELEKKLIDFVSFYSRESLNAHQAAKRFLEKEKKVKGK